MDDADRAQEQIERELTLASKYGRSRGPSLKPCGACHFCSEPVNPGLLFCDVYCRDDYERYSKAHVRNGKVICDDSPDATPTDGLSADLGDMRLEDLL